MGRRRSPAMPRALPRQRRRHGSACAAAAAAVAALRPFATSSLPCWGACLVGTAALGPRGVTAEESTMQDLHGSVHSAVVEITNRCYCFQNDIYQRFSGFVIKFHMGRLCERVLSCLAAVEAAAEADTGAAGAAAALEFQQLDGALDRMLTDTNSQGDWGLRQGIQDHLGVFASEMAQLAKAAGRLPRGQLIAALLSLLHALRQVVTLTFDQIEQGVTYNIGRLNVTDLPRFLSTLDAFPASAPLEMRRAPLPSNGACDDVLGVYRAQHVVDVVAEPQGWRTHDVSGLLSPRPSAHKLLYTLAKAVPLSYNLIAVAPRAQVGTQELTSEYRRMFESTGGSSAPASAGLARATGAAELSCGGVGLSYSPAHCLFDLGWGSMMFSLSTEPPFDGVLAVSEMSKKGSQDRPQPFVQPIANESTSLEQLVDLADSVYKSLNTPSPDVLYLSPMVGNCLTLRKLGPSRRDSGPGGPPQLTPKLIWVPLNPLVPPPWRYAPNFSSWHPRWLEKHQHEAPEVAEATWWFVQCSLASATAVLAEQGYVLLHMEHSYAVFVLKGLRSALEGLLVSAPERGTTSAGTPSLYDHWLQGWHCSAAAPSLFGLERIALRSTPTLAVLHDRKAPAASQKDALCDFARANELPLDSQYSLRCEAEEGKQGELSASGVALRSWDLSDAIEERGKAYMLESSGRGRCLSSHGFCECFPPYRGRYCENEEPGRFDDTRDYRAVLHYLVGDREKLMNDFVKTLPLLWERFNGRFDYPVVVFHDGLSPESRKRIIEASANRIWFAFVSDYVAVPAYLAGRLELELGGYGIGYRGMCRFRSGTMFTQPVMRQFDYAWTLDSDGYFPAEILDDPFARMHRGGYAYAYSHISRDQASAVQHFWEFSRLYFETKGLDPKSTKMMRRITDALVLRDTYWHEWNRVLFMNDIEITRLSWFRSEQYQDYFAFLDSVGGFWLYRWGDHAVRTIAIALFMDPNLLMRMEVPYGHQNTCRCGAEHPGSVCVRETPSSWWRCVPAAEVPAASPGAEVASNDVGTVAENLIFGGE